MSVPDPVPRPRRRRLRRIVWTSLLILVVLPALIAVGVMLALRASGVRRAVLERISSLLREQYGLAFTAEDFSPLWLRSGIELRQVRVGAPGAAPLATAERVEAVVDLGSLRSQPLVVRSLAADGLRIDLAAPLPKIPESKPEAGAGPAMEIRKITIRRGEVLGAPLARPAVDWVRSWSARGIEARGAYRNGRLDLEVEKAEATLDRPGFGRQELRLAGRVGYEEKKPLAIDGLRVTGDGLRLAASGSVGLAPGEPTAARFEVDAEPRALVAGLPPRGQIHAAGRIALPENAGQISLTAKEIPAEALKPYLDPKLYADLALAGTAADLAAEADLGPGGLARVAGGGRIDWRRGRRTLARANVRVVDTGAVEALEANMTADLLPGSPGRRSLQGTLRAASWKELALATAENARAQVQLPDVRAALAEARSLWPRLIPAPPPEVPLQGSLAADVHLSGPLAAPVADVDATWLPQPGSRVRLEAKGQPRTWSGSARVQAEALPLELLGALAPGLAGTVDGTAELSGSRRGYRTRVEARTAALAFPPSLERLESGTVTADGTVVLSPFSYRGALSLDGAGLVARPSASSTARLARFSLTSDGTLAGQPLTWDGTVSLDGTGVEVPGQARVDHLQLSAQGRAAADLRSLAVRGRIDADRVTLVDPATEIRNLHVEAEGDGREVRLSAFSGELPAGRTVSGSGRAVLQPLLSEADLDLHLVKPLDGLVTADLTARLREGIVELNAPRLDTTSGPASLRARVPLGALRQVPQLAAALDALPGPLAQGPITLSLTAPALDSEPLLAALGMEARPERVRAGVSADLTLDLATPVAGRGEVRLSGLTVETPDGRVTAEGPAVLRLADGRLVLPPVHLRIDGGALQGAGVDLQASADLARSWRPFQDPVSGAVTRLAAEASGTLDAALLNPYLQGGAAAGSVAFSARASGPPDKLTAEVRASGPGASFDWPSPAARITDPKIVLDLADGRWTIREGTLGVNGGTVDLAGGFSAPRGLDVEARLKGVRYRLEYGIETLLSGQLAFRAPPGGSGERSRLSGRVTVEQGVLDRDLNLDREVFTLLFKPPATPSTEASALANVDLDLRVETTDGVRVKNNVGDLRATWRPLTVGGTLDVPVIRGRIDVDPGGLFYAYGQTVRIDSGALIFTGNPATDPKVDLTTTSSVQDPTITRLRGGSPLDLLAQPGETPSNQDTRADTRAVLASGFTSYYGARVLQGLTESAGLGGFSVRPVLVFNEADPSARLTVGRDLSRHVSLAVTVDLRNAERQTYLFYVQELSALPGLRVEGFTNDAGHRGGSLQQAFDFGGGKVRQEPGPRLRRLDVSTPKQGVSKRAIRGAVRLRKKQPVPAGAAFTVQVDVADLLRRKGYPGPRIDVVPTPVDSRPGWVDVAVTVEPGPRVSFAFADDAPARTLRPEITSLYRTDFYEAGSLAEMRKVTVRAFRSAGYLDPQVAIEVRRERPEDPDGARTVTIRTQAGRRRSLQELRIAGLPADVETLAAAVFPGTLARAELAARGSGADALLLAALRGLGYPEARIVSRFVPADGSRLVVTVEPGLRQTLAAVRVVGEEGKDIKDIKDVKDIRDSRDLLPLRAGDPARVDLISRGALLLEDDLRQRGYADATVRSSLKPVPDRPGEVELIYEVASGKRYQLAGVEIAGERWSRPAPLRRETGLAVGEPLTDAAVAEARNRLFRTGVFSRVDAAVAKGEDGEARVTFSLAERPRFHLGYGVRYESSVGTAAVIDLVDQNFLGRAFTLGLRGLYQNDDRSGRLYLRTGGLLGTRISLESYADVRRLITRNRSTGTELIEDRQEIALQASRPFATHDTARLYARYRTTRLDRIPSSPFFPIEVRLPYLGVQLLRDTRDDRIDPGSGLFASFDLSGSGAFLGSDFQYARLFGQAASFRRLALAGRRSTWAQSARLGLAHPFAGQTMIRDELFFAGGPFSVRGYAMESLGPAESFGTVDRGAGGEALFVLNEELRFALPFDLTGLAFFDAGQVWGRPGDASFDLAKSIGLGLRARTPLGLLRFDAAYPLDRRPGDERYKLYFGCGNAF